MKPLTIEQLRNLEVGDWAWLIETKSGNGTYAQLYCTGKDMLQFCTALFTLPPHLYSDYGKTWLAYKNKEQAEAKGEIVELPCKVGDTVYAIMEIDYKYKIVEFIANRIVVGEGGNFYFDTPTSYSHRLKFGYSVFADKSEAERRLAELTKE